MEQMSDFLGKTLSFATAAFGVNIMNPRDFAPLSLFFFVVGIFGLCFISGLVGEAIGDKFKRAKDNVMGLGNRHG